MQLYNWKNYTIQIFVKIKYYDLLKNQLMIFHGQVFNFDYQNKHKLVHVHLINKMRRVQQMKYTE